MDPCNAQIGDVACVDLGERTVVIGLVGTMVGQPVILAGGFNARGIHRLSKRWRGGERCTDGKRYRYGETFWLFLHGHFLQIHFYSWLLLCRRRFTRSIVDVIVWCCVRDNSDRPSDAT